MRGGMPEVWQKGDKFHLSWQRQSMTRMMDGEPALEDYFPDESAEEIEVLTSEKQVYRRKSSLLAIPFKD